MNSSSLISDLLKNVQQLNDADFEDFFTQIVTLHKTENARNLSEQELNILTEIREGLPKTTKMRFDFLLGKRDALTINQEEYQELLALTSDVESWELKRLQLITQLAEGRNLNMADVVELFRIEPVPHG